MKKNSFPTEVEIFGIPYHVYTRNEIGMPEVVLVPHVVGYFVAKSGLSRESIHYTRGSVVFRAAVDRAKELAIKLEHAPVRKIEFHLVEKK